MLLHFIMAPQSLVRQGLLIVEGFRDHTQTHHTRQDSSGRVISQQPQETDIQVPSGIRTRNPST